VDRFRRSAAFFDGDYRATFSEHLDFPGCAPRDSGLRISAMRPDDRFAVMALNGQPVLSATTPRYSVRACA